MNFSCEREALVSAVNITAKAASPKSPIPALEGILLEAGQSDLKLTGYDLKKGIYTRIEAQVSEMGSIVLPARILAEIAHALPDGRVSVKTDGMNTSIRCARAEYHIMGSDSVDYPELPSIDGQTGISLPQDLLSRMIRQTIFAVSDNESRPVYTGELFEISGGSLTLVAVDGYRLALRRETVEGVEEDCRFIVPGNALNDLEKLCGETDEPVHIHLGSKHISFTLGNTVLVSRRLDGEFLNYKKSVPASFQHELLADCRTLQRAIERVSLIIDDKIKNPLRCTFGQDQVRIVCATSKGRAEDFCGLEGDGGNVEIGFNNRYVLDALKACPAEQARFCLNSGSSPCVLLPADGSEEFLYMILPVRLKAE